MSSAPAPSKFKRALVLLGLMSVGVLGAYAAGRLQTEKKIDTLQAQAAEAYERRDAVQNDVLRLEARRRLHLAVMALDERNFGIAEKHLQAAERLLKKSKPQGALEALRAQLAGLTLRATDDLGAQRKQVLAIVAQLDTLVPPSDAK